MDKEKEKEKEKGRKKRAERRGGRRWRRRRIYKFDEDIRNVHLFEFLS